MNQAVPIPSSPASAAAWRVALPALALAFLLILVLFRETAMAMASIWVRSDTYAHGLIVPPLTPGTIDARPMKTPPMIERSTRIGYGP